MDPHQEDISQIPADIGPILPTVRRPSLTLLQKVFRIALLILPVSIRKSFYHLCQRKCARPYFPLRVYHLRPLGLVLKVASVGRIRNEAAALRFLRDSGNSAVNYPVIIDSIQDGEHGYMLSTWVDGDTVCDALDDLTPKDKARMELDIQSQFRALRAQTTQSSSMIRSACGEAIGDNRVPWVRDSKIRSFDSPLSFAPQIWIGMDHDNVPERVALRPIILPLIGRHAKEFPVSFCHGDLYPKNMIFPGGLASWRAGHSRMCFIDWEQAGWMPVYWDALKAIWFAAEDDDEWFVFMRKVFSEFEDVIAADWKWRSRSRVEIV